MKSNEEQALQDDQLTEIEYTPIRRKSRESGGVCVREDEISVSMPDEDIPCPSPEESEHIVTPSYDKTPVPSVSDETIAGGDFPMDDIKQETEAPAEDMPLDTPDIIPSTADDLFSDVVEEEAQNSEEAVCEEAISFGTTDYERVVLPDEISLADVLPLMNQETETEDCVEAATQEEAPEMENAPEDASSEEMEEEFVFTPMPELVEYERVVLPDEISLVDVLDEIRPTDTEEASEACEAENEETIADDAVLSEEEQIEEAFGEPTAEFILPDDIVLMEPTTEEASSPETTDEAPSVEAPTETEESVIGALSVQESASEDDVADEEASPETETPDMILPGVAADEYIEEPTGTRDDTPHVPSAPHEISDKKKEPKERPIDNRFDLIELFAFTLAFVLLLTTFFFRSSAVVGSSMERTLHDGDQLILYSFMYKPEVGDIIVFEDYSTGYHEPLVKRVIATEGQRVEIYDAYTVFVDGVKLEEDYIFLDGPDLTNYPIIHTVEEGHIFVMGDHRNGSSDSRKFRDVSVETVLGKVIIRYYPFDTFKKFD